MNKNKTLKNICKSIKWTAAIALTITTLNFCNTFSIIKEDFTKSYGKNEISNSSNYTLNYLEDALSNNTSEMEKIDSFLGSGKLATLALTTYGLANRAMLSPSSISASPMASNINKAMQEDVYKYFNFEGFDNIETSTSYTYLGYLNLMIASHRLTNDTDEFKEINKRITDRLSSKILTSKIPLLETYKNKIWIADNSVIAASIAISDIVNNDDHSESTKKMIKFIEKNMTNKDGLMFAEIIKHNGKTYKTRVEASTIAYSSAFFYQIDKEFSKKLHLSLKNNLRKKYIGFSLIKEYNKNNFSTEIDNNAGIIFLGYSSNANLFYEGVSRLHSESINPTATSLMGFFKKTEEYKSKFKILSPLSDATFAYFTTLTDWYKIDRKNFNQMQVGTFGNDQNVIGYLEDLYKNKKD